MTFGNNVFAFQSCDNNELKCIHLDISYGNTIKSVNESICSNIYNEDIDKHLSNNNNCKYYTIDEFQLSKNMGNFNIFHNNLNGLENKFEILHNFLTGVTKFFDIMAITETSYKLINENFITNISIQGYSTFSTPTTSNKGGATIYVKGSLHATERLDLNVIDDQFESVWIEIKNKKSKNIICGSIYKHSHDNIQNFNNFLDYMETTLNRISDENKEIYICGDFNSDFLKMDKTINYKKFYEQMYSYGLLPQITQPARVTDNTATIVDNIFTNNMDDKIFSGNIITDFSDHYTQFVSVVREKIDYKSIKRFKWDYSKFSEDSFTDDVSIQNFNNY